MTDGTLPILPAAGLLPAAVRDGGVTRQQEYQSALSFERSLLVELTKQLSKTATGTDEDSAATKTYREQLPTILADALIANGGVGIAASVDAANHAGEQTAPRSGRA